MKSQWETNTERLTCNIRIDIKAALLELAAKRQWVEGGKVGLPRMINEAALLLLEREGVTLPSPAPQQLQPKPVKQAGRRKRTEAMRA